MAGNGKELRQAAAGMAQALPKPPLPQKWLGWVVVGSLVLFFLVLGLGAFFPSLFQQATAKFFVCVLAAFLFAIGMFFLFPQEIALKTIPFIELPVSVVGPPALFFTVLAVFWLLYPGSDGRTFRLFEKGVGRNFMTAPVGIMTLEGDCSYYAPLGRDESRYMTSLFVEFRGASGVCKAQLGNGIASYTVTFNRLARSDVVELVEQAR